MLTVATVRLTSVWAVIAPTMLPCRWKWNWLALTALILIRLLSGWPSGASGNAASS
jgi:hypothetical protein